MGGGGSSLHPGWASFFFLRAATAPPEPEGLWIFFRDDADDADDDAEKGVSNLRFLGMMLMMLLLLMMIFLLLLLLIPLFFTLKQYNINILE